MNSSIMNGSKLSNVDKTGLATNLPINVTSLLKICFAMSFPIADTFTESLACLTGEEQKALNMTSFSFDLSTKPAVFS